MGGVGLCHYSRREDWYSGNAGDIGGVERAPAVCIFGRGVRDWKGPAVCIFGRPFPQKRERCAARSPQPSLCETGSRVGLVECEIGLCVAKVK